MQDGLHFNQFPSLEMKIILIYRSLYVRPLGGLFTVHPPLLSVCPAPPYHHCCCVFVAMCVHPGSASALTLAPDFRFAERMKGDSYWGKIAHLGWGC